MERTKDGDERAEVMVRSAESRPVHLVRPEEEEGDAPDDRDLLAAYVAGDTGAFDTLVKRYQRPVYRLALRYARDRDEAEELAQRTFLRVLDHASSFDSGIPFKPYLFRIAANLCKNHLRDRAKLVFGVPFSVASSDGEENSEALERKELRAKLRGCLAKLPLRQRQVVSLRIDAELPFAEISESLGISENNAKVSYHNAVKRLRTLMQSD